MFGEHWHLIQIRRYRTVYTESGRVGKKIRLQSRCTGNGSEKCATQRCVWHLHDIQDTKKLKAFLIELFSNPKMREAVPETASAVAEPGVFSIGQHMENNVVGPTAADVSKIHQDMNDLQVRFNKITSADFRSKSNKPWKPEVTPPRRRGGFNRGRGHRQFDNAQRNDRFKNSESNSNQDRDNDQRNNTGNFRGRGQGRGNFRGNMRGKGRGRGRFDKSPNVRRPRVASKTVD